MKKIRFILPAIVIAILLCCLTACADARDITAIMDEGAEDIAVDNENCRISFAVGTESFDLTKISFPDAEVAYFSDENCENPVGSVVSLTEGENVFYVKATLGKNEKVYTVVITRKGGSVEPSNPEPPDDSKPDDTKPGGEDPKNPEEKEPDEGKEPEKEPSVEPEVEGYAEVSDAARAFMAMRGKTPSDYCYEQKVAIVNLARESGLDNAELKQLSDAVGMVYEYEEERLSLFAANVVSVATEIAKLTPEQMGILIAGISEISAMSVTTDWGQFSVDSSVSSVVSNSSDAAKDRVSALLKGEDLRAFTESADFLPFARNVKKLCQNLSEVDRDELLSAGECIEFLFQHLFFGFVFFQPEKTAAETTAALQFYGNVLNNAIQDVDTAILGAHIEKIISFEDIGLPHFAEKLKLAKEVFPDIEEEYVGIITENLETLDEEASVNKILYAISKILWNKLDVLPEAAIEDLAASFSATKDSFLSMMEFCAESDMDAAVAAIPGLLEKTKNPQFYYEPSSSLPYFASSAGKEEILTELLMSGSFYSGDDSLYFDDLSEAEVSVEAGGGLRKVTVVYNGITAEIDAYIFDESVKGGWELTYGNGIIGLVIPSETSEEARQAYVMDFLGRERGFRAQKDGFTFYVQTTLAEMENFALYDNGYSAGEHTALIVGDHELLGNVEIVMAYYVPGSAKKLTNLSLAIEGNILIAGEKIEGTLYLYYDYYGDAEQLDLRAEGVEISGVDLDNPTAGTHYLTVFYGGIAVDTEITVYDYEEIRTLGEESYIEISNCPVFPLNATAEDAERLVKINWNLVLCDGRVLSNYDRNVASFNRDRDIGVLGYRMALEVVASEEGSVTVKIRLVNDDNTPAHTVDGRELGAETVTEETMYSAFNPNGLTTIEMAKRGSDKYIFESGSLDGLEIIFTNDVRFEFISLDFGDEERNLELVNEKIAERIESAFYEFYPQFTLSIRGDTGEYAELWVTISDGEEIQLADVHFDAFYVEE